MIKKTFIFRVILVCSVLTSFSQKVLTNKEALSLKENIIKASKLTSTIANDFVQSKHLSFLSKDIISKGKLIYKAPNLIKWGYNFPFKYSVIFKDHKLFIDDNGTKSDVDLSANKSFKELNTLIVKSVKGDMFDQNQFKIAYYKKDKNYLVSFTSKDKDLKSLISKFELTFDSINYHVLEIKMIEDLEDYTSIKFINQKINKPVSNETFNN